MREPFSLEGGTSANSFAFMERSPANVFDPARNWGAAYTKCGYDEAWTLSGGVFFAGLGPNDVGLGPGSTTDFTLKGTGLGWYDEKGKDLMHFGVVVSERYANNGFIIINERPQTPLLDFSDSSTSPFIPKLKIPANFQQLVNVQWAYVHDSFWAQAEWYGSQIDQIGGGPVFFHGAYLDLGYFFTGEHRAYLKHAGVFGAVSVQHPLIHGFSSKTKLEEPGYGAFEGTLRVSYLDLVDKDTPGGLPGQVVGVQMPLMTVGVNWYLADRLRLMFNYTYAVPDEATSGASSVSILGMRLGLFW